MLYLAFLPFQLERYLGWVGVLDVTVFLHVLTCALLFRSQFLVRDVCLRRER